MDFTEKQVFEALGVEPKEESVNTQEVAEPAQEVQTGIDEGENVQELAEPAEAADTPDDNAAHAPVGTSMEEAAPEQQTPEQNREFAARRRKAEKQAEIDRAVQEALANERARVQADQKEFFARAGLKNTITGEPINDMDEFNAWKADFDAKKLENDLKAGKLTPDGLNQAISGNPTIKRAEELIRRNEQEAKRRQEEADKVKIDQEIAEIQKMDPSIREVKDLLTMPNAEEFRRYVMRGNSFVDAYYLANREKLTEATAQAAKAQAMNNARSKEHLSPTRTQGGGAVSVPSDEMALFREFMPGASESEIQNYYNKYKNK